MSGVQKHKKKSVPKSPAVKAALVEGLLSDSQTHIHMLVQSQDQQLMSDTMQQLALNPKSIDAFLRVLSDMAAKHPQSADKALQWLNKLMEWHSGYIVSSPELTRRLSQLRARLQLRVASFDRLLLLKGKLDLLLGLQSRSDQLLSASVANGNADDAKQQEAAGTVVYQEFDESDLSEEEDEEAAERGLTGQLLGNGDQEAEEEEEDSEAMNDSHGDEDEEDEEEAEEEDDDDDDDEKEGDAGSRSSESAELSEVSEDADDADSDAGAG